jgi:hypothetical protein
MTELIIISASHYVLRSPRVHPKSQSIQAKQVKRNINQEVPLETTGAVDAIAIGHPTTRRTRSVWTWVLQLAISVTTLLGGPGPWPTDLAIASHIRRREGVTPISAPARPAPAIRQYRFKIGAVRYQTSRVTCDQRTCALILVQRSTINVFRWIPLNKVAQPRMEVGGRATGE